MKTKALLLISFSLVFQNLEAQVQKVETYLVGTKVTYYSNQCGNTIPEAQGKISFCDSQNNLGVVESSYGLNSRAIKKMVPNYYNDDEVFITPAGISIKKTDGTWENIPNFVIPRASLNGNSADIREAVVNNDGLLFFFHGNNFGLHYFDLTTKTFGLLSYNTNTGGSHTSYTHSFAYDVANNITYIMAQSESNLRIYKYENSVLSFIAGLPAPIYIGGFSSSLLFANDALYLGTNTGLYKLNKTTIALEGSFLTDATQFVVNVKDIADDGNGNLWVVGQGYYDAAIYRFNMTTEKITTYQLANEASNNYTFNNLDIDNNGTVWATAANLSGIVELIPNENNPTWVIRTMEDMGDLGFYMTYSPLEVFKFNNKIYFMTTSNTSSSPDANYEAVIFDNGVWSGITDDEVNNISEKMMNRYHFAYPDADGIWWYNYYDGGIMTHISNTDEWEKQFNLGNGISSFILDVDGNPVINASKLKKVYMPYAVNLPDHGSTGITQFHRFKDQIWMFSNNAQKIYGYKYNQLVQTFDLDETSYAYWYNFTPDINGNAFFAKYNNMDLEVKKFDTNTQTTTTFTSTTYLGGLVKLIPLPNGNVAVICGSGIFVFDGTHFSYW